ncbi:MAG: hypothetical protein ACR2O8_00415 [Rhizobiaceae bacterium]
MADYHAVLQRTLSGFTNPKPELRTKLYARARTTIARQLENRTPPVSPEAQQAELEKLELAIVEIERSYNPVALEETQAAPEQPAELPAEPQAPKAVEPETAPIISEDAVAAAAVEVEQVAEMPADVPDTASPTTADPVFPEMPDPYSDSLQSTTENTFAPDPQAPQLADMGQAAQDGVIPAEPAAVEEKHDPAVEAWAKELSAQPAPSEVPTHEPAAAEAPASLQDQAASVQIPVEEPASQPVDIPTPPLPLEQVQAETPQQADKTPAEPTVTATPAAAATTAATEAPSSTPTPTPKPTPPPPQPLDSSFETNVEETLVIPPAQGFGEGGTKRRKRGGFLKWFLILLVLALLGGAGFYGWMNKEIVFEKLGMSHLLDDPTRPKPVKTITITPEPAQPEEPAPEPEPSAAPKVESRLGADGEEVQPTTTVTPVTQPVEQPTQPPAASEPATGAPPIAQSAILYEEGATSAENSVDAGRVVWSVVEDAPTNGETTLPAIQGRIEIPDRDVVLIMTIKRNADKALPASHLIELVFAVPDDFPGGGVGQISRFVLKENEQGRGEGLIGVPARIADGIFLIALNNLDQAKQKNESLLKSRDWIDIPIQYSTGRRALMTIEKGLPGSKVFDEVFAAWEKQS